MEDKQSLGILYISYMVAEVAIGVLAIYIFKNELLPSDSFNNILLYALGLQIILHIGILIDGFRKGKSDLYAHFFPFSVPPIIMIFISWYNTF